MDFDLKQRNGRANPGVVIFCRNDYICQMRDIRELIVMDPEVLGGKPVFKGTRVPVSTLFSHLERGLTLDEFLNDFPTVRKDEAIAILEFAERLFSSGNFSKLHETAA
jgi:uncharacterized protein (DUF433 family)